MAFRTLDGVAVAGQARAAPRRPQRAGARRQDHRPDPHRAAVARPSASCPAGRAGDRVQPFRPAEGQAGAGDVAARRWRRRSARCSAGTVRFAEDCIGLPAEQAVDTHGRRRRAGAGKHPLPPRRGEERPGLRRRTGQARRHLRQRRLLGRASRACQHRGGGEAAARLCRPADAGRAGGAGGGAGASGAAGGGDRRRRRRSPPSSTCSATWSAKVDVLVIGGAMANTFLAAQGIGVGKSLQEAEMHATARDILAQAARRRSARSCCRSMRWSPPSSGRTRRPQTVPVDAVPADAMILDVGPATVATLHERLAAVKTLVWNGPLGAFETPPFDAATVALARAVAAQTQARRAAQRGRRRRHRLGAAPCRGAGPAQLRLVRRRRLPGMDGRQDPAGSGGARSLTGRDARARPGHRKAGGNTRGPRASLS